jgi:hypothetical protein
MKKRNVLAILLSAALVPSPVAADPGQPRATLYVELPIGASSAYERAPRVGFMVGNKSIPLLNFALSRDAYRRKATMDPFEAADLNWWLIGGIAAAVVLVASQHKSSRQEDQKACLNAMPPPPGC